MTQSNMTLKRKAKYSGKKKEMTPIQKVAELREMLKEATEVSAILHCWHFE